MIMFLMGWTIMYIRNKVCDWDNSPEEFLCFLVVRVKRHCLFFYHLWSVSKHTSQWQLGVGSSRSTSFALSILGQTVKVWAVIQEELAGVGIKVVQVLQNCLDCDGHSIIYWPKLDNRVSGFPYQLLQALQGESCKGHLVEFVQVGWV